MNEGKQDLEGARLQQMLERSCWKTNNEKNKLDMVLWNTSQNMRWQPATYGKKNWIDMNNETRNLFHREDKWSTWIIYKHHKWQQSLGKALGEI